MPNFQTLNELSHFFTCLHEAGHAVAVLRSTLWGLNDPAIRFPDAATGHLARAHFGRKNPTATMTVEQVREIAVIGYAGYFAQNILDNSRVFMYKEAGCQDDFDDVMYRLSEAGIAHEQQALWNQSKKLVEINESYIILAAELIYESGGMDVPKTTIASVLMQDQ